MVVSTLGLQNASHCVDKFVYVAGNRVMNRAMIATGVSDLPVSSLEDGKSVQAVQNFIVKP